MAVVYLLPGFIVLHLLKLGEFFEKEWANLKHGRACFALVSLCLCRGGRPVPASLSVPLVHNTLLTTAGFQDIGKLVARQAGTRSSIKALL